MKIVCSQSDLKTNLSLISRAVPTRPTHPILANVLLTADGERGKIELTAFDLSLGIRTSFPAQVVESGTITLPAKLLNDIVSRLPEGEITIFSEEDELEDNPKVEIQSLSGKFQLRGFSAEEFPELPTVESNEPLLLPIASLAEGLKGSLFAASNDETKQVLTGVHLIRNRHTLEFAATDGHRLAVVQTSTPGGNEEGFAITVPARALRELEKMLAIAREGEFVTLYVDEGQVVFELGQQHLTSRKLEGAYPNYNQLIPAEFAHATVVERKRLLESLERVSVFADQKNNLVKFTLDSANEQVYLSVEAKELGSARESIPAQITGDDLEIGFNIRYLMDGLKAISANDISFQCNGPNNPATVTPLSGLKMTYLLMPVRIKE